jgi:CubicO group peptidase (beta-lactamase class C family)
VGLEFDFDGRRDEGDDALPRLAAGAAASVPSERFWSYTNVGWCLLGRVIESVTDGAWEDAMRLHLLEGAKMSATTFATDAVTGDEVTEEEWSRVFAAFGPHLPDEEREARTP